MVSCWMKRIGASPGHHGRAAAVVRDRRTGTEHSDTGAGPPTHQFRGATRSRRCYCNALYGVTLPAMLLAVSYRDVRHGRPWGAKLSEQRSLLLHGGRPRPRGQGRDSQHLGGWEPGSCGTVNTREALLNAVSEAKRKMLTRLDQNGTWSSPEAPNSSGAADAPPAERRDLTRTVTSAERGKPVVSPFWPRPHGKATRKRSRRDSG